MKDLKPKSKVSKMIYVLLMFGILISGPRFSGAFAAALGIDLMGSGAYWAWIEIMSGWALGLFEALAFAFIASRFRQIQVLSDNDTLPLSKRIIPANAVYWVILFVGMMILLLSIPAVATVHLATQVFRVKGQAISVPEVLTLTNIYEHFLTWAWLFVLTASSTLFVFLIGLVIDDFGVLGKKEDAEEIITYKAYTRLRKVLPIVDPQALAKEADIPVKQAADFLDSLAPSMREPMPVRDPITRLNAIKQRSNGSDS